MNKTPPLTGGKSFGSYGFEPTSCRKNIISTKCNMIVDEFGRNIEGYWWSKYSPNYPMPVANVLTDVQAKNIFESIKKKEKRAGRTLYRGFSVSRIDKSIVGSAEFKSGNWIWPEGFAEHYVLKHKVKPSDEFLKFINYL